MICYSEKRFFTSNLLQVGGLDSKPLCYPKAGGVEEVGGNRLIQRICERIFSRCFT